MQVQGDLRVVSYWIDTWFSKTEGNTYATLLHHPFLFKGKPTHAQEVAAAIVYEVFSEAIAWRLDEATNLPRFRPLDVGR